MVFYVIQSIQISLNLQSLEVNVGLGTLSADRDLDLGLCAR